MARIDKGLITLVGRDRDNPRTHREAFEITDGLGEMLDKHIKRNNLNKSEFIREAVAAKLEAEMPKEPLIKDKDEKARKAVRAFSEVIQEKKHILVIKLYERGIAEFSNGSCFWMRVPVSNETMNALEDRTYYTIDELCGAPEPLEPTLIDLDERIKEKEEE